MQGMTGHMAVATAVKNSSVDVVAGYPITPQSEIVELIAKFIADGKMDCEYIPVESEHSALSALIGAGACGVRTFTASCGPGVALFHELIPCAAGLRLPIVTAITNRSYSAPISIWSDHTDALAQRDSGAIQMFCESNQEAHDSTIMAYKVCENKNVLLPSLVSLDGFILSHVVEAVNPLNNETVESFLPELDLEYVLDSENPYTLGPVAVPDVYMEFKYQQEMAMDNAMEVIKKTFKEFEKLTGRKYDLIEEYQTDDAETVILTIGAITTTARLIVDELRKKGKKVGLIKLKVFRPFPKEELKKILSGFEKVGVIDKNISFGSGGIVAHEVKSCLYDLEDKPTVKNFIVGLGGRDVTYDDFRAIFKLLEDSNSKEITWIGVNL
ncbi:MAG: pyruvate ferredoxin oxidoreductase [Methanobacterium sp.]|jgi:pyruvate ferredoxin oxidoreductase alpha subunit